MAPDAPAAWPGTRHALAAFASVALLATGAARAGDVQPVVGSHTDVLIHEVRQQAADCGSGPRLVASAAGAAPAPPASDASVAPARPALRWNPRLAQAAQRHAGAMARTGLLDHVGADGTTVRDRVTATGYRWSAVGETLATGHATLEEALAAWLTSPAQCEALLDARFTEYGLASARSEGPHDDSTVYWALVLARPR